MTTTPATSHETSRQISVLKGIVSLWLVYHFLGVFIAPASIPPSSNLVRSSWEYFGPYLQLLYLNHGFHFFAPDPGPSTVVEYELEFSDGRVVRGRLPDLEKQKPRLAYHRSFMLTEYLGAVAEDDPQTHTLLARAMARRLCDEHGAGAVTLKRVTHLLPSAEWRKANMPLNAPELREEYPIGRFVRSDL